MRALSRLVCVWGLRRHSHFTNPHQRSFDRYVLRALRLLAEGSEEGSYLRLADFLITQL